ncbi:unnamed protein product [Adineta steineri]|uniref:UBA domain-containing protein n=1 Tax=Adineta steineri TaxID=433720 RepID=A0A815HKP2_9BILA|nr:unnamed protein product [Adineta steineri]
MMNTDGTGTSDDQQMISINERENFIGRLTNHFGGNRDSAVRFDDIAYNRSGGKLSANTTATTATAATTAATAATTTTNNDKFTEPTTNVYATSTTTNDCNASTATATATTNDDEFTGPTTNHLQQVRQQNHLNQQQQQQQDSPNSSQLQQQQQQQQPATSSVLPQPSSSSSGSQDEILQHILTSPNPPKQPSNAVQNAAQVRLRNMNRNVRNQPASTAQATIQQQPSPIPPGSDPMITSGSVVSPHSHPSMMQQQQQQPTSIGPPGQSPLARYMMAQSPQNSLYRPQASPMNMINYTGSPTAMIDDEMHFLFKFFNERILHLTRVIARYQQDGQHDKVAKYRQLQDQMSNFVRNPIPEHLMSALVTNIFSVAKHAGSTAKAIFNTLQANDEFNTPVQEQQPLIETNNSNNDDYFEHVEDNENSILSNNPIDILIEMGFANRQTNQLLLSENNNDLNRVIEILTGGSIEDID